MKKTTTICTFCSKEVDSDKISFNDTKEGAIYCEDCFFTDDWLNEDTDD